MAVQKINHETVRNDAMLTLILNAFVTWNTNLTTLINELRTDHATFKASMDELETWAEALATKLNADAGVTDADYDATITNSAPATITAAAVTAQVTKGK